MLLRLMPVTSGTITYQGRDVTNIKGRELRSYRRDVQAVFQTRSRRSTSSSRSATHARRGMSAEKLEGDTLDALIETCSGYVGLKPG